MKRETFKLHPKDFEKSNISVLSPEISKCVGGYRFGNQSTCYVQLNLTYRPNWIHRTFMKVCLGMYWYDL